MTPTEITLFASGISVGVSSMIALNTYWIWLDDRRDRKAVQAAEARLKAAEEKV